MNEPLPESHPDPIGQALSKGGQMVAEFTGVAALAGQGVGQLRAKKAAARAEAMEKQTREALEQAAAQAKAREAAEAAREAGRAGWAPLLDGGWRADAGVRDIPDIATAWAHAARWEADPAAPDAAEAADNAERLLRNLHPYAMARYDERVEEGWPRAGAVMATIPFLAADPSATPRPWPPGPPAALPAPQPGPGITREEIDARHLLETIAGLSAKSAEMGLGPLTPSDAVYRNLKQRTGASDELIRQTFAALAKHRRVLQGLQDGTLIVPADPPAAARTVADAGPGAFNWQGLPGNFLSKAASRRRAGRRASRASSATASPVNKLRPPTP
jgi:hypothetical protein